MVELLIHICVQVPIPEILSSVHYLMFLEDTLCLVGRLA
jgi:hypothetical protein